MSEDRFRGNGEDLLGPATRAVSIAAAGPFPFVSKRIWVGAAGAYEITLLSGQTISYAAPAGTYLQVRAIALTAAPPGPVVVEY